MNLDTMKIMLLVFALRYSCQMLNLAGLMITTHKFGIRFHHWCLALHGNGYGRTRGLWRNINGVQGFCDFMQEMLNMMDSVRGEPDSLEDLQKMFVEMVSDDGMSFDFDCNQTAGKRPRGSSARGTSAAKRQTSSR